MIKLFQDILRSVACQIMVNFLSMLSVNENKARRLHLRPCFKSTPDWFGEKKFNEPWNYGAGDARAVCVFRRF